MTDPGFSVIQGLALVGSNLAVSNAGTTSFYDAATGALQYSFANSGSGVEGLTYDGTWLWELDDDLVARDPLTGVVQRTIPNAALGCTFTGSGIANGGSGSLVLGCTSGAWYRVSSLDGSVLGSGNNGVNMLGLNAIESTSTVPEPASLSLMITGLAGVLAVRRRRKA